jgi:hypothetical protein
VIWANRWVDLAPLTEAHGAVSRGVLLRSPSRSGCGYQSDHDERHDANDHNENQAAPYRPRPREQTGESIRDRCDRRECSANLAELPKPRGRFRHIETPVAQRTPLLHAPCITEFAVPSNKGRGSTESHRSARCVSERHPRRAPASVL